MSGADVLVILGVIGSLVAVLIFDGFVRHNWRAERRRDDLAARRRLRREIDRQP